MVRTSVIAAVAAAAFAAPAGAGDVTLYPWATHQPNHCPQGLQPVVLNGVICCGQPDTHVSYQQVMKHPVQRARRDWRYCPEGEKGC
ncbi:hypothetical protein [Roseovarius salinarum]|uniref:hypothetical protein n=1 Tax=Roseovarius salinarum TaxID=1981892 RepID=UPI000C344790|nr:hypothetical protein [Roseovarius salinarum]